MTEQQRPLSKPSTVCCWLSISQDQAFLLEDMHSQKSGTALWTLPQKTCMCTLIVTSRPKR